MFRVWLPLGWAAGTAVLKAAGLLAISRAAVGRLDCICSSERFFMVEESLEVENALAVAEGPEVNVPAQCHHQGVNQCDRWPGLQCVRNAKSGAIITRTAQDLSPQGALQKCFLICRTFALVKLHILVRELHS